MRVTPKYCEMCGIKISIEEIRQGKYLNIGDTYYCSKCKVELGYKETPKSVSPGKIRRTRKKKTGSISSPDIAVVTTSPAVSKQFYLFLALGGAGILLFLLTVVWALSSPTSSSSPQKPRITREEKPKKKKTLKERFEEEFRKILASNDSPEKKLFLLGDLERKYSTFLKSPKGREKREEWKKAFAKYKFAYVREWESQKGISLIDKIEMWKQSLLVLKGSEWEQKARKRIEELKREFQKQARIEYERLLEKAQAEAKQENFAEAIAILNRYPYEFRETKYWKEEIPKWKRKYEKLAEFWTRMNDAELEAQQAADYGDFDRACEVYRRLLAECPKRQWKEKLQEKLKELERKKKEYLEKKKKEEEERKRQEEERAKKQREREKLTQQLRQGKWVSLLKGKKLLGWTILGSHPTFQEGKAIFSPSPQGEACKAIFGIPLTSYSLKLDLRVPKGYFIYILKVYSQGFLYRITIGEKNFVSKGGIPVPRGNWFSLHITVKGKEVEIKTSDTSILPRPYRATLEKADTGFIGFVVPKGAVLEIRGMQIRLE